MRGEVVGGIKAGAHGGSVDEGCYVSSGSMPLGKSEALTTSWASDACAQPVQMCSRRHGPQHPKALPCIGRQSDLESVGDLAEGSSKAGKGRGNPAIVACKANIV